MAHLRRHDNAIVVTLLSLMMAFNAYEAAALCIGCDGHIAIEPVGHGHCADGSHLCESDLAQHRMNLTADSGLAHCRGCIDIPLGSETCSDPAVRAASKVIAIGMLAASTPVQVLPADALDLAASAFPDSHPIPLRSVVLQV